MGRPKKAAASAESVQEQRDELNVGTDTSGALEAAEGAVPGQIIGPADESELLGCQEDEAELKEGLLVEYAVASANGLRLRQEPSLDAAILAVLPQGDGVFCDGEPGPEGWFHVRTGRLEGWMLARHLEELPLPELFCSDG